MYWFFDQEVSQYNVRSEWLRYTTAVSTEQYKEKSANIILGCMWM